MNRATKPNETLQNIARAASLTLLFLLINMALRTPQQAQQAPRLYQVNGTQDFSYRAQKQEAKRLLHSKQCKAVASVLEFLIQNYPEHAQRDGLRSKLEQCQG